MNLDFPSDLEKFRAEVRDFVRKELPRFWWWPAPPTSTSPAAGPGR